MPALLETAVSPVMEGLACTVLMRVSGTPQRPKPPARRVERDCISAIAALAEETTLSIAWRLGEEVKVRAKRRGA